jgi:pectate lyase
VKRNETRVASPGISFVKVGIVADVGRLQDETKVPRFLRINLVIAGWRRMTTRCANLQGDRATRTALALALLLAAAYPFGAIQAESGGKLTHRPEGFGAISQGGRGGRVITVSNLADSGPGSLREALAAEDPRIIRVAVGGVIELRSPIRVSSGRVTIDGATAPGNGVTLQNHGIHFLGDCDDIIVRHLRIRVTTGGSSGDALLFWGREGGTVERVLVDHCSLMWATDEVVNTWGNVRDLTCQWSIIAEGQSEADHPKGPHSMGWLSGDGTDRVTVHHCLFAHNGDRSPRVHGGVYDLVNNVVYNWTNHNATKIGSGARVNVVGSSYIAGPQSAPAQECILLEDPEKGTQVYVASNIGPLTPTSKEDAWRNVTWYERVGGKWKKHQPAPKVCRAPKRFQAPAVTTHSAEDAYDLVLRFAGAKVRDMDDIRVVEEVRTRTGQVGRGPQNKE